MIEWNEHFMTGVEMVDSQHRKLVNLINNLARQVMNNNADLTLMQTLLKELLDYTEYHFSEEELMMDRQKLDPRHVQHHHAEHRVFLRHVRLMPATLQDNLKLGAEQLLQFLTQWLVYDILGEDQNMVRQIRAMEQDGNTAAEAFAAEETSMDGSTEILLCAMNQLFHQLSERNLLLTQLNSELERKVAQRTVELSEANKRLAAMANTDDLTRLPNRRLAMKHLEEMWERWHDKQKVFSCLMIDADHFKGINDQYGHAAGDEVLRRLAERLKNSVRTDDVVSRLGGDEFMVSCPDTNHVGALQLASAIGLAVAQMVVDVGEGVWQGSVSIGVGSCSDAMIMPTDVLQKADEGVYAAKAAGRNCVRSVQMPASPISHSASSDAFENA